jgi:hypothetical protein
MLTSSCVAVRDMNMTSADTNTNMRIVLVLSRKSSCEMVNILTERVSCHMVGCLGSHAVSLPKRQYFLPIFTSRAKFAW